MHDHSDWYDLFNRYWWLVFPLFWGFGQILKSILRHNRASDALNVLKSYADQGKEPPPELVAVLRAPDRGRPGRGDRFGRYGWIPVFLFGSLAAGFVLMALFPPNGAPPVAMLFVALIMAGLCIGNLVAMLSRGDQDRLPPP